MTQLYYHLVFFGVENDDTIYRRPPINPGHHAEFAIATELPVISPVTNFIMYFMYLIPRAQVLPRNNNAETLDGVHS